MPAPAAFLNPGCSGGKEMLKLHSRLVQPLSGASAGAAGVRRIADERTDIPPLRHREYFLVRDFR
jgi:hypothetical protein